GRAGVAIADVTVLHEDEVAAEAVVRFLAGDGEKTRTAITRWARDVGFRRLWLPDNLIELPGPAEALAETRCNGCAVRLSDDGARRWWGKLVEANFDRVRGMVDLRAGRYGLSADERQEAVQRALVKLWHNMVRTFRGSTMGEWVNSTKQLVEFACQQVQRDAA